MKLLKYCFGLLSVVSLIIIFLITSFELVVYGHRGFYEKAYTKYEVEKDVQMKMDDILNVTDVMLDYLKNRREDLQVETVVNGENRMFFNERELSHMEDVKMLFTAGIRLRVICLILFLLSIIGFLLLKLPWTRFFARCIQVGTITFLLFVAGLSLLISTDFTKYFTIFHELFFDNDLWILDPKTDLLINILPEGFFVDIAAEIAVVFLCIMVVALVVSTIFLSFTKRKQ